MFQIEKVRTKSIPIYGLADNNLSLAAKGLYAYLFAGLSENFELNQANSKALDELKQFGYVEVINNKTIVHQKPITKTEQPKNPLKTQIEQTIKNFTNDVNLQVALNEYFNKRLNPDPGSRFSQGSTLQLYHVHRMLNDLTELKGDKVKIVRFCLEKQYFKFFELQEPKKIEGVQSNTYTQEDIEENRKKLLEVF